jgi:hypothetical protein
MHLNLLRKSAYPIRSQMKTNQACELVILFLNTNTQKMKKITSLRFSGTIIALIVFALIIKSCKKVDHIAEIQKPDEAKATIIGAIKQRYGNVSGGVVYNFLKPADQVLFRNKEGKMVDVKYADVAKGGSTSNIICPNCAQATSLGQLTRIFTLNYVKRIYKCESANKSTLIANWTIDVPYHPMSDYVDYLPYTYGTISITAPGGGSPLTHTTYTPGVSPAGDMTIKYLGVGSCIRNRLYEVTYSFDQVPDSYFGNSSGTAISCSINIEDDCSWTGGITYASYSGTTPSIDSYLPCNRTDIVFVNPPAGSGNYATAAGAYVICTNPSGFLTVDGQQVEYRKVTSGSSLLWDDQTSTPHWGESIPPSPALVPSMSPTGVLNLKDMLWGTGTWLVRYRNVKTSVCDVIGSSPGAGWGSEFTWVVEVWVI